MSHRDKAGLFCLALSLWDFSRPHSQGCFSTPGRQKLTRQSDQTGKTKTGKYVKLHLHAYTKFYTGLWLSVKVAIYNFLYKKVFFWGRRYCPGMWV